jgi:hypothetical protein
MFIGAQETNKEKARERTVHFVPLFLKHVLTDRNRPTLGGKTTMPQ